MTFTYSNTISFYDGACWKTCKTHLSHLLYIFIHDQCVKLLFRHLPLLYWPFSAQKHFSTTFSIVRPPLLHPLILQPQRTHLYYFELRNCAVALWTVMYERTLCMSFDWLLQSVACMVWFGSVRNWSFQNEKKKQEVTIWSVNMLWAILCYCIREESA